MKVGAFDDITKFVEIGPFRDALNQINDGRIDTEDMLPVPAIEIADDISHELTYLWLGARKPGPLEDTIEEGTQLVFQVSRVIREAVTGGMEHDRRPVCWSREPAADCNQFHHCLGGQPVDVPENDRLDGSLAGCPQVCAPRGAQLIQDCGLRLSFCFKIQETKPDPGVESL